MKEFVLLGSTGSIGAQTLEVVEKHPHKFKVVGLCANKSWQLLAQQAKKFSVSYAAIADEKYLPLLKNELAGSGIKILSGEEGILQLAQVDCGYAVAALVGVSGLLPTLKAIESGKNIALANKETLVVGGEPVMSKAAEKGISILPIDSEHSAIFQCINGENLKEVKKIYLTSSGGPFRNVEPEELAGKTAADALKHPTWNMGNKVTIDSSTLMNKGFEVIEARWLFNIEPERIEVIIHPQSIIHSMVEFIDGSIMAQLSYPDMRIPIQYALSYPERLSAEYVNTDFLALGSLTFEKPKTEIFRCLLLAFKAIKTGGTMPAVLNGANEIAVSLFLENKIDFLDIQKIIESTMNSHTPVFNPALEDILEADKFSREFALRTAEEICKQKTVFP